ncbi:hypothetical protein [Candidatus Uabimicrobium sp. HlEnr_7]|uniref:hypothetical protein n=1 Tax=Candidatus Uabimicrobium helgolandensis TaxID=3095367 RepID=UPI003557EA6E
MEIQRSYLHCETQRVALELLKLIIKTPNILDKEIDTWMENVVLCEGASWNNNAPPIFVTEKTLQKRYDKISNIHHVSIKKRYGVYGVRTFKEIAPPSEDKPQQIKASIPKEAPKGYRFESLGSGAMQSIFVADAEGVKRYLGIDISDKFRGKKVTAETFLPPQDQASFTFEKKLGDTAGRPGVIERIIANSVYIVKFIHHTIGLRSILFLNIIDNLINIVTSYINSIFQSWKLMRSIYRRLEREDPFTQVESIYEDIGVARFLMSRSVTFAGFFWEDHIPKTKDPYMYSHPWEDAKKRSLPSKLILDLRGHLDEMKRDLTFLNWIEIKKETKKSIVDFLFSFIPNPLEWFAQWRDIFITTFFMKYSRDQIEEMYVEMLIAYEHLLEYFEREYQNSEEVRKTLEPYQKDFAYFEQRLIERFDKVSKLIEKNEDIEKIIQSCRRSVQKIQQLLVVSHRWVEPQHWSRVDLVRQIQQMVYVDKYHAHYCLEFEKWLTKKIRKILAKKKKSNTKKEIFLQKQEARDLRQRINLSRKIGL